MKIKNVILFVVFTMLFLNLSPKTYKNPETNREYTAPVVDLCILPDKGSDIRHTREQHEPGPTTKEFARIITQEEALVVSDILIDNLINIYEGKYGIDKIWQTWAKQTLEKLFEHYILFKSKKATLGVFIPKATYKDILKQTKSDKELLSALGLNSNLEKLEKNIEVLKKTFTKETFSIAIDDLIDLFPYKEPEKNVEKRIFLAGHGGSVKIGKKFEPDREVSMAMLQYDQYIKLLEYLGKINTVFLYVKTCYACGWKQLTMHTKETRDQHNTIFKTYLPPFIVATGSLTDSTTSSYENANYNEFFRTLHDYLYTPVTTYKKLATPESKEKKVIEEPLINRLKRKEWISKKPLSNILKYISGSKIGNLPSLYIPYVRPFSKKSFFRTAEPTTTQTKIINYPFSKKIPVKNNIKHLLIYPMLLTSSLTYEHKSAYNFPQIISLIPGNAHHYIEKMQANIQDNYDLSEFLSKFSTENIASDKLFFVGELIGHKDGTLYLQKPETPASVILKHVAIMARKKSRNSECICQIKDNYYQTALGKSIELKKIDKKIAIDQIKVWIKETTPAKEAIKATIPFESEEHFKELTYKLLDEKTKKAKKQIMLYKEQ